MCEWKNAAASPATAPKSCPGGATSGIGAAWRLKERILLLIRELYREGYRHFITGMALGIDTYCCEMVLRLEGGAQRRGAGSGAALPGPGQRTGAGRIKERYRRLVAQCDLQTLVQEAVHQRDCMLRRDRYMVSRAECVMGVYDGMSSGGTRVTLDLCLGAAEGGQAH